MKKTRLLSFLLTVLMILTAIPGLSLAATAAETAEPELPPTLPGETVYKWGYYAPASGGSAAMHYRDTALGTVDQSKAMCEDTIGAEYVSVPMTTLTTIKRASYDAKDFRIDPDGLFCFGTQNGTMADISTADAVIHSNLAGIMLRIKNTQADNWGGMGLNITVHGKTYSPTPCGSYPGLCHIYYYDYTKKAWYAEELVDATNFRLPESYDGYLFFPLQTFLPVSGTKDPLTPEEVAMYGITSVSLGYRWRDTSGMLIKEISAVYALPYGTIDSVTPTLGNELGLKVVATVMGDVESATMEFAREGAETVTVTGTPEADGRCEFNLGGIGFAHMTDEYDITLKVDGVACQTIEEYSIRSYGENLLRTQMGVRELAADLLSTGAVFQTVLGYNAKDPATARLTDEEKAFAAGSPDLSAVKKQAVTVGSDASTRFAGAKMWCGDWVGMQVTFRAASTEGLTVTATVGDKTYTYNKFYPVGEYYCFVFDHINPSDLNEEVTFTFNKEGTGSLVCSFASALKLATGGSTKQRKMAEGLWNLYTSAKKSTGVLVLTTGKTTNYKIICANNPTDEELVELYDMTTTFRGRTGVSLGYKEVGLIKENEYEIILAPLTGRDSVTSQIARDTYFGYSVQIIGTRIVIFGNDTNIVAAAFGRMVQALRKQGNDWVLPLYYSDSDELTPQNEGYDIKLMETKNGRATASCQVGSGNFEVNLQNVTEEEVRAYVDARVAEGYSLYTSNQIGDNLFFTLTKAGEPTLHVHWYKADTRCKLIACGEDQFLPPVEPTPYTPVEGLKSYVMLATHKGTAKSGPGMTYILQLCDGRYIIIDGGTYLAGENDEDLTTTLKYLQDNNPNEGKPVIACWMFTHEHGDHTQLAISFLSKHHNDVEVQMIAHNFPDFTIMQPTSEGVSPYFSTTLVNNMKVFYPDSINWVMHAGQKLQIADAEIEVYFTWEDYYPSPIYECNTTCTTWRITINGVTFLVGGDSSNEMLQYIADVYGTALESDIVQGVHHGFNDKAPDYYKYANAKIDLIPEIEATVTNNRMPRYLSIKLQVVGKWTRGSESGNVIVYHDSTPVKVYFDKNLTTETTQKGYELGVLRK